jgi:hypothetical protein
MKILEEIPDRGFTLLIVKDDSTINPYGWQIKHGSMELVGKLYAFNNEKDCKVDGWEQMQNLISSRD